MEDQSFWYRIHPGIKLLFVIVINSLTLYFSNIPTLIIISLCILLLYKAARISITDFFYNMRLILWSIVFIFVVQSLFSSWQQGMILALRFFILLASANWVSETTSSVHMLMFIENLLKPLKRFGVQAEKISFMLLLSVRFVPILQDNYYKIREGQKARGIPMRIHYLLIPFILRLFKISDEISDALDARGYDSRHEMNNIHDSNNINLTKNGK